VVVEMRELVSMEVVAESAGADAVVEIAAVEGGEVDDADELRESIPILISRSIWMHRSNLLLILIRASSSMVQAEADAVEGAASDAVVVALVERSVNEAVGGG
jgi:hypothetical protein